MALYQDIIDAIIDEVDTTSLNVVIQNYLDRPENGFFNQEEVEYLAEDGTNLNYTNLYTTPNITVEQWKALYLEQAYSDAKGQQKEIIISDSNSPSYPVPDFESLTNKIFDSGGLFYGDSTADVFIQYEYPDVVHIDVASLWCDDSTCNVYFAYSKNGTTWNYLRAQSDHTLDSNGRLLSASSKSNAEENYLAMTAGDGNQNAAKFPLGIRAKYVRLYLLTATTVYELAYRHYLIPEQLVVDFLSALSADVGEITAGTLTSDDGSTILDLNNDVLEVYDANGTLRVKLGKL